MVIKRVAPMSCAKVAGMLYAIMGLIFGGILSIVTVAGVIAAGDSGGGLLGSAFGAAAIVLLPILYGCLGFVMTLIMAVLFNVVTGMVGGVVLDVE